MSVIRVTKEFTFEAAHALYNYDGQCSNIHGHSYKLYVTVRGIPVSIPEHPKNGMVMDFSLLKDVVNHHIIEPLDHSLIVYSQSPQADIRDGLVGKGVGMKIVECSYPPTCEMMISDFAEKIRAELPQHVELHSLRLYETATSYAEWYACDNI
ncbi:MAG: 6-carboxytetrahydropterin synthase [Flavobacteriales bacterium]|nr:6-carboxytetrahydropterin synthase [Flavobacteriales bacterium]